MVIVDALACQRRDDLLCDEVGLALERVVDRADLESGSCDGEQAALAARRFRPGPFGLLPLGRGTLESHHDGGP